METKNGSSYQLARYVILFPDLGHLLAKLFFDEDVTKRENVILGAPIDIFPEAILGPVGYIDDVGLAIFASHSIINRVDKQIILRHWAGDENLLVMISQFINVADEIFGSGMLEKDHRHLEKS